MSVKDDGGPAFAGQISAGWDVREGKELNCGMSLRDYFAAKYDASDVIPDGVESIEKLLGIDKGDYAKDWLANYLKTECKIRYMFADAMLEARKQ